MNYVVIPRIALEILSKFFLETIKSWIQKNLQLCSHENYILLSNNNPKKYFNI